MWLSRLCLRSISSSSMPRPACLVRAVSASGMRHHTLVSQAARLWHSVAGCRLRRLEWWLCAFYLQRAVAPWQLWLAAGAPPQFRPRFRFWLYPLGVLLRVLGWLPRARSWRQR